ncbi:MAG: hypothetical protein OHK0036_16090 [Bacteroidia bacterium]
MNCLVGWSKGVITPVNNICGINVSGKRFITFSDCLKNDEIIKPQVIDAKITYNIR